MSLRKFLAPNAAILILLSFVWLAGIELIYHDHDHHINLSKYLQVQQRIVDNYVGETEISHLFKSSMVRFVRALNENGESAVEISGTPADTVFQNLNLRDYRDAYSRFEEAYLFVANNYPDK